MTRGTPPSDWVAYVVVLGVTISIVIGKYLIARGDPNEVPTKNDDNPNNRSKNKEKN